MHLNLREMKRVKTVILSSFIIAIIAMNFSVLKNNSNFTKSLNLNSLQIAFANEIEEITITCDGGGEGICYEISNVVEEFCNGILMYSWGCTANGDPISWCTPYDPC
jgi:plastocyanin domain-containing protein